MVHAAAQRLALLPAECAQWTLLADATVFHALPSPLSLTGAGVIAAASLGALLWTARAGSAVGCAAARGTAEPPAPQHYQATHYGGGGFAGAAGAGGSSLAEAVSLLRASAVADAVAAKQAALGGGEAGEAGWQLGTEVEPAPDAGPRRRASMHAASTDGAVSVELQVASAPVGRRTSSEKERALQRAGK